MDPGQPASVRRHSGSRCQRMVSLALNMQLKEKLNVIRSSNQINKAKRNNDPDYVPGLSSELSHTSGSESDPSYEDRQITSSSKKVHILSNVLLVAPASVNQADLNTPNYLNVDEEDCTGNPQENLSDIEPEEIEFNPVQVFIRENILQKIIDKAVKKAESKLYTKTGEIRKRKKFEEPLVERKKQKIESYKRAHEVKKSCNEECWACEEYEIHKKATSHEADVENLANCDVCKKWKIHKLKATNARKKYQEDAEKIKQDEEIIVAADLQKRGNYFFSYKTDFENEFTDLKDIFIMKYVKGTLTKPQARNTCRGVSLDRKNNLISKLKAHIPQNRMKFWEDLPVCEDGFDEEND
ncbi:unnamed protein product [Brassicogethes aeneus]|uniref:Uncharacterized protein n=1 Tax=Brassicogethes aeneus TaxID=1431903 RepID=A0A9P0FFH4_BRAAE|nr:unnamed protein product [Brassicogethes aeneus]